MSTIKSYKGFNKDMKCRGFQYEEGKDYETDKAVICDTGFHACEKPLDAFIYYKPSNSVYHEVEQSGEISRSNDGDSKVCSTKNHIGARIGIAGLVKAQIDFVLNKIRSNKNVKKAEDDESVTATSGYRSSAATSGSESSAATSGDWSSAATSGHWSSAVTSGDWSSAATSGYRSSAATSGNGSSAVTSGDWGSAATSNKNAIAVACGRNSVARGVIGSYLVLTEWSDDETELLCAKMERVDGDRIKADTWYKLVNGEFAETEVGWIE